MFLRRGAAGSLKNHFKMEEMGGSIKMTWSQFQANNAHNFLQVQCNKDFTDVTLVTEDGNIVSCPTR